MNNDAVIKRALKYTGSRKILNKQNNTYQYINSKGQYTTIDKIIAEADAIVNNFDKTKQYVCQDKNGNTYPIVFSRVDGHPYAKMDNGQMFIPLLNSIKEAPANTNSATDTNQVTDNNAENTADAKSANTKCADIFKDGAVKNSILNMPTPVSKISLNSGKLIIEHKNNSIKKIVESLNLNCPDYLLLTEAEQFVYEDVNINKLLKDNIQKYLASINQQVIGIAYVPDRQDYSLKTTNNYFWLSELETKAKEYEQEEQNKKNQAVSAAKKMSKEDISTIANTVVNALNAKVNKYDDFTIDWEIDTSSFDANTIRESKLNEDLRNTLSNIKNKIAGAIGTNAGRQMSMTNRSVPSTFGVKANIVNSNSVSNTSSTEDKGQEYMNKMYKDLWNQASKILNNYTELNTTDENGNQVKTKAIFKLDPTIKSNGVFVYKTVMNMPTTNVAQGQVEQPQTDNQEQQYQNNNNQNYQPQTNWQQTEQPNKQVIINKSNGRGSYLTKSVTKTKRNGTQITKNYYSNNKQNKNGTGFNMPSAHAKSMR